MTHTPLLGSPKVQAFPYRSVIGHPTPLNSLYCLVCQLHKDRTQSHGPGFWLQSDITVRMREVIALVFRKPLELEHIPRELFAFKTNHIFAYMCEWQPYLRLEGVSTTLVGSAAIQWCCRCDHL